MKKQVIEFDDELEREINAWRGKQNPIPPFKEAVTEILKEALKSR